MGLRDMLLKLKRSQGPEGYAQYKHERKDEQKQHERAHDEEMKATELERETAERERGYADRYADEHEGDVEGPDQKDVEPDR